MHSTGITPCSDAERRRARALATDLKGRGRRARLETAWVRPQWPAIWLLHAVLGLTGSVLSVDAPEVGLALCALAAASALGEISGRFALLSLLWPRRATQNVVSSPPSAQAGAHATLVITAAYGTRREPPAIVRALTRVDTGLRDALGGRWPHPLGLLTLTLVALAALSGARVAGTTGPAVGAAQLLPTIVCLAAIGVLIDLALARGGQDEPAGPALALSLARALDAAPPKHLAVELVLAGASDGAALGLRAYVRDRARRRRPEEVVVVHLEPGGAPRFWTREGPLMSARLHPELVAAARAVVAAGGSGAVPHHGRGTTGALETRRAGWPTLAVGGPDSAALALSVIALVDRRIVTP
jgi:hypothetical protein